MRPPPPAAIDRNLLRRIEAVASPWPGQVELQVEPWNNRKSVRRGVGQTPDPKSWVRVRLRWQGSKFDFVAQISRRSTPSVIEAAVIQAKRSADQSGVSPLVIVPYLDDRRMDRLVANGVSGLDLSGNGVVSVPGRLLLRSSGQPNRYPESQPMRFAYRGATSLVPRVFLCQPRYESVSAIQAEIEARGGAVALSTVSKALARMADDVLIDRASGGIALLQPDALVDKLAESFRLPKSIQTIRVKTSLPLAEFLRKANKGRSRPRVVLAGVSSQDRYAAGRRSDEPQVYCEDIAAVRAVMGKSWRESERFADVTIIETDDRAPFFDARLEAKGILAASPVQAFLELTLGDKRDREMGLAIRQRILRDLK